jgi:ATP-dependent Clp protease, protease subunit
MKPRFIVRNQDDGPAVMNIRGPIDSYFDGDSWSMTDTEQEVLNELSLIPKGKPTKVYVNCPGGRVALALGIHNAFKSRAKDLTFINAGEMLSSATILPPEGSNVICPKASVYMVHRPALGVQGDIGQLENAISALKSYETAMASVYTERTGKSNKAIRELMEATTWMSGDEAVEQGFADSDEDDSDSESYARANFDPRIYASFKGGVPERFKHILAAAVKRDTQQDDTTSHQPITTAAASISATAKRGGEDNGGKPATPKTQNSMIKIITALVAAGFKLPAEATEDQVLANVSELITSRDTLTTSNKKLKEDFEKARKDRIEAHVQIKVDSKIIKAELKDKWVNSILENEGNQALLDSMEVIASAFRASRGAAPPPVEDSEKRTAEQRLEEVRTQISTERDPVKIAALAKEARELRGHKDLFAAAK